MPEPPPPHFQHLRLRLRFWTGGQLRDEVWLSADDTDAAALAEHVATHHAQLAHLAEAAGVPWLVEAFDPSAEEGSAYVRYGTDTAGMVQPVPVPRDPPSGPMRRLPSSGHRGHDGPEEPEHDRRRGHGHRTR